MFHLPPPPRFILPPPPMFSSDIFHSKILLRLTCSSIRQQQIINPRLVIISCTTFFIISILLTLFYIWIQSNRHRQKSLLNNSKNVSICSTRSYETISSRHTGIYLESINTSATTLSTNPSHTICIHCQRIYSPLPYYYTIDT